MTRFRIMSVAVLLLLAVAVVALAQGPAAPPPSCEEKLDNANYQWGGVMQQLAVVTAQLRAMTKERDAALAKAAPKKEPEKK